MFDFLKVILQQLLPVSFHALARPFHLSLGRTFLVRVVSVTCPDNSKTPSYQPSVYNTSRNLNTKVLDFVKFGGPSKTELRTFRWEVLI